MLRHLSFVVLLFNLYGIPCFSQGQTAVPFLLISPYAETNGMGEASVANPTDDPLSPMTNPAHLGMLSQFGYFSFGYNYSQWLPTFGARDLWLKTLAANVGINLQKLNKNAPPLSFGLGYSRLYLNLGTFIITGPGGPTPLGTFDARETSDQFTMAVGADYWVRASVGLTYKHVVSRSSPVGTEQERGNGTGIANLYDYGFLIDVPLVGIASRLADDPFKFGPNVSPYFDWTVGISRSNLGQGKITYIEAAAADPLPRYARAGIGVDVGFVFDRDVVNWKPLSFKWSIEASDVLVGANREYQSGLGDINFFDEVILGNTNMETEKKKGWELNVFEVISVRGGRFEEDPNRGNRRFNTSGWGVRLGGMLKMLRAFNGPFDNEGVSGFLLNHIDVGYNHSEWNPDQQYAPLSGTKFDSFNITVYN